MLRSNASTRLRDSLTGDLDAVTRGLTTRWNSGPIEGRVNHVKMLKRQMFGRATLPSPGVLSQLSSCFGDNCQPSGLYGSLGLARSGGVVILVSPVGFDRVVACGMTVRMAS